MFLYIIIVYNTDNNWLSINQYITLMITKMS